jgi:hypothetical protein
MTALGEAFRVLLELRQLGRLQAGQQRVAWRERQRGEANDRDPEQNRERDKNSTQDVRTHRPPSGIPEERPVGTQHDAQS